MKYLHHNRQRILITEDTVNAKCMNNCFNNDINGYIKNVVVTFC